MGLLNFLNAIIITASVSVFSPKEHFVINTKDNGAVRISYMNEAFVDNFLGFNEGSEEKHVLRKYETGETMHHAEIISGMENQYFETSLLDIWTLLSLQPDGRNGELSNFTDNIFYIRDVMDITSVVLVKWSISGWYIGAFSVDSGERVAKGSRIFIRKG